MAMHLKIPHLNIRPLFYDPSLQFPSFYKRIDTNTRLTGVNVIIIDGKSQTGKSTLADSIAKKYDPNYRLVYTVEDYLNFLMELKDLWFAGEYKKCMYRWVFFDEPQLEIPRTQFWSERNAIIQSITSSFGFLKPSLIMALPNIKGLSDMVLTNVLFRASMSVQFNKEHKRQYVGWVKTPYFHEKRNRFCWRLVETHYVPDLQDITTNKAYMDNKVNNFFNVQLPKWQEKLDRAAGRSNRFDYPKKPVLTLGPNRYDQVPQ